MVLTLKRFLLICLILIFNFTASSLPLENHQLSDKLLVETKIKYDEGLILFIFNLESDYHITDLKYNFFKIELKKNEIVEIREAIFPEGVPYEGERVFKDKFEVKVYIEPLKKGEQETIDLEFKVFFQLCQEQPQEVCFQPESENLNIKIDKVFRDISKKRENINKFSENKSGKKDDSDLDFFGRMLKLIKQELEKKSVLLFLLVFVFGFLTSFTPCVYPVVPIVMGYIGTRSGGKKLKGFSLSIFFVLGLALVYSILGVIAAMIGSIVGVSFQNPIVVVVISGIFITMGLSLAGFFEIPVPSFISSKVHSSYKSEIFGALLIGGVSGVIAAPCAGPFVVSLLSWISQTRNVFLGFGIMFIFSLGFGVIFIIAGTFSGIISSMPKGGKWMSYIKYFFSVLLIIGGIYILTLICSLWLDLFLWGVFLISTSTFMGLFKSIKDEEIRSKIYKVIVILIFVTGVFLFFKSLETKYFPKVLDVEQNIQNGNVWLSDLEAGKEKARRENKNLMIDVYADWCIPCKKLEKYTFLSPEVRKILKNFILVKLDLKNTDKNLIKSLKIVGPPTIIFLNSEGKEIKRFFGFKDKNEFKKIVNNLK